VIVVKPRRRGPPSPQQTDPRRIAHRPLAVGIRKKHTPPCESIDVWRVCLRMTTEATDPIVEIVHGNEENVGIVDLGKRWRRFERQQKSDCDNQCSDHSVIPTFEK
jgi:hypothetical protein